MSADALDAFFVGLDAGGSSCKLLADGDMLNTPISLVGPAANVQRLGAEAAAEVMVRLIESACREAGVPGVRAVCAGMAGAGQLDDQNAVAEHLRRLLGQQVAIRIMHDAALALEAALPVDAAGILVIAGTGSIAYARAEDGKTLRAGGWGYLFSDEGSGHVIGAEGLRAIAAAYDGGPPTSLRELLVARHGLSDQEAIIHAIYRDGWAIQQVAPLVLDAAAGDPVAQQILIDQTDALARRVGWLAERAQLASPTIALWGGLTRSAIYRTALKGALHQALPACTIMTAMEEPVTAALRLARALA